MKQAYRQAARLARELRHRGGTRVYVAFFLQCLAALAEGVSILFLIPILGLLGSGSSTTSLEIPEAGITTSLGLAGLVLPLWLVLATFVGLVALIALFTRLQAVMVADTMITVINGIRLDFMQALAAADWSVAAGRRQADLTHILVGEMDRVHIAATSVFNIAQITVMLVVYGAVSALISVPMTLAALTFGVVMLVLLRPVRRAADRLGRRYTHHRQSQYRMIEDFMGGLSVIRSLNAEDKSVQSFAQTLAATRDDGLRFTKISTLGTAGFQILSVAAMAVFVLVGLYWVGLSAPALIVLILIMARLAPRAMQIDALAQQLLRNLPAYVALDEERARLRAAEEPSHAAQPHFDLADAIKVKSVSFGYGPEALGGIDALSVTIPAKSLTAVTGPSGAGKTTLGLLLSGLTAPSSGEIWIDDQPLTGHNMRGWRSKVGYVSQDSYFLHDTITNNLRLASPDASDDDIWRALDLAQAREFVDALPKRLETHLGAGETGLSGGEKQRLSLARALLRRPLLLVLDEVTGALDLENETRIARALKDLRTEMTIVAIAHRPALISLADHVITLDDGRCLEGSASPSA